MQTKKFRSFTLGFVCAPDGWKRGKSAERFGNTEGKQISHMQRDAEFCIPDSRKKKEG